jgi:hypothetical protein
LQKGKPLKKGFAQLKIADMQSGLSQTYHWFWKWMIFSSFGWLSEYLSG